MSSYYVADHTFARHDFPEKTMRPGEYEACVFRDCDLSNANLSSIKFIGCTFESCDLSLCNVTGASFQDVVMKGCKVMGLQFDKCNAFNFSIRSIDCQFDHASFYGMKLKKFVFENTRMRAVDFTAADLTQAVFDRTDLEDAHFENTNLEKADLRTAFNVRIDPEKNRMKKARFSIDMLPGLLLKYELNIE